MLNNYISVPFQENVGQPQMFASKNIKNNLGGIRIIFDKPMNPLNIPSKYGTASRNCTA